MKKIALGLLLAVAAHAQVNIGNSGVVNLGSGTTGAVSPSEPPALPYSLSLVRTQV